MSGTLAVEEMMNSYSKVVTVALRNHLDLSRQVQPVVVDLLEKAMILAEIGPWVVASL
jgi:hypothetical protein